jgi:exosortase
VLTWWAGFGLLFGRTAVGKAYFPLAFSFFVIPPPHILIDRVTYLLQTGSAWITGALFDLFGIPCLREGFVFHLPRFNIEVARECSGIRSSIVLLILALVVAHFYLTNFWNKVLFVICGLCVMVLKNGLRIATLAALAMYVNPDFLAGRLHRQGGVVFFLVGLLFLLPVLRLMQRAESRSAPKQLSPATSDPAPVA